MANATCSIEGCERAPYRRGMCNMHHKRWLKSGDPGPARSFRDGKGDPLALIDKDGPGGCWLWTGWVKKGGYGLYRNRQAHRFIYELLVGPVAPDLDLDHLCRVRRCVNPKHLEPVTRRENLARSTLPWADALRAGTCMKGHPFTEENTAWRKDRPASRRCRTCDREGPRQRRGAGGVTKVAPTDATPP